MRVFRAGFLCAVNRAVRQRAAGYPCGGFARVIRAAADCARFRRRGYPVGGSGAADCARVRPWHSVNFCGFSVWAAVFAHARVFGLCAGYSVRGYGLRVHARFARFARFPRFLGAVYPCGLILTYSGLIWAVYGVFTVRYGVL